MGRVGASGCEHLPPVVRLAMERSAAVRLAPARLAPARLALPRLT